MDPVRCIYPDLGADCCTVRQQGNPQDPEPCHRCDPGGAGHCSYVFSPVSLADFLYRVYFPAE